ncbi:hypothetical protein [Naasia lichenicola]|uniref:Uncharacterized protein n=1 Tax=Naasia lichenicola TaxID=2565933 RepID=A0A4S4FK02_9MICO|nr:hypothetical protein [Naasia lichenicola]THG30753.1 hypothetical protein E6C64_08935 [Naasia lichenicola]THG31990.1 hypothetical protein E6C64_08080 [Naasia lichenicola]
MSELEIIESPDGVTVIQHVGFSPTPRVSLQALRVIGGTVLFDVAEPLAGARVEIVDRESAIGWLESFYPDAVATLGANRETSPAETGSLYSPITRLMTAMWLHRSWPDEAEGIRDIDLWMLDSEAAELAWIAGAALPDGGLAASLLLPHTAEIAAARDTATDAHTHADPLIPSFAAHVGAAAEQAGVVLEDGVTVSDEPNAELLREAYPTPDDEYDAFRVGHLVEGIVRARLQSAYATAGVWTSEGDATIPFAAEIVAARRKTAALL